MVKLQEDTVMKYYFKEKFTFLFDRGELYDEAGNTAYTFQSTTVMFPEIHLYGRYGEIGMVQTRFAWFLSKYDLYLNGNYVDRLQQELTLFRPRLYLEEKGWTVQGDFMHWDYDIIDAEGNLIAQMDEELWHLTKHFVLNIYDEENEELILLVMLGIFLKDKSASSNAGAAAAGSH